MSSDEAFQKAADEVKNLKSTPKDEELLELYALFKQATVGNATDDNKPGMLDFKGKAKFEAWSKKKDISKDDAKKAYVAHVEKLIETYGKK